MNNSILRFIITHCINLTPAKYLILTAFIMACGKKDKIDNHFYENVSPESKVEIAVNEESLIEDIVNENNIARYEAGQAEISPGLLCKVYKYTQTGNLSINTPAPGQTKISGLVEHFRFVLKKEISHATQNQNEGISFFPDIYKKNNLYQQEVYVDCSGFIVATETKANVFGAISDDNIIFLVNNITVSSKDYNHGVEPIEEKLIILQKGLIYPIRIQYRQFNGPSVLKLFQNSNPIATKYLFH